MTCRCLDSQELWRDYDAAFFAARDQCGPRLRYLQSLHVGEVAA